MAGDLRRPGAIVYLIIYIALTYNGGAAGGGGGLY